MRNQPRAARFGRAYWDHPARTYYLTITIDWPRVTPVARSEMAERILQGSPSFAAMLGKAAEATQMFDELKARALLSSR